MDRYVHNVQLGARERMGRSRAADLGFAPLLGGGPAGRRRRPDHASRRHVAGSTGARLMRDVRAGLGVMAAIINGLSCFRLLKGRTVGPWGTAPAKRGGAHVAATKHDRADDEDPNDPVGRGAGRGGGWCSPTVAGVLSPTAPEWMPQACSRSARSPKPSPPPSLGRQGHDRDCRSRVGAGGNTESDRSHLMA